MKTQNPYPLTMFQMNNPVLNESPLGLDRVFFMRKGVYGVRNPSYKHGMSETKICRLWYEMKRRCYNKKRKCYSVYGGRGITICEEWKEFLSFYNWAIMNGYKEGLQIDRIDNNGNYQPDNCRFVTMSVNCQNRRLLKSTNTSGYRGANYHKNNKNWFMCITYNRIHYYKRGLKTVTDAALEYDKFVIKNDTYHPLNFPYIIHC
jgi:hypothetical protein